MRPTSGGSREPHVSKQRSFDAANGIRLRRCRCSPHTRFHVMLSSWKPYRLRTSMVKNEPFGLRNIVNGTLNITPSNPEHILCGLARRTLCVVGAGLSQRWTVRPYYFRVGSFGYPGSSEPPSLPSDGSYFPLRCYPSPFSLSHLR